MIWGAEKILDAKLFFPHGSLFFTWTMAFEIDLFPGKEHFEKKNFLDFLLPPKSFMVVPLVKESLLCSPAVSVLYLFFPFNSHRNMLIQQAGSVCTSQI